MEWEARRCLYTIYGGHSPLEVTREARLDALAYYGGYYERVMTPVRPIRISGEQRFRLNPSGLRLYDIWFSHNGRRRQKRLIGVTQHPEYYTENGDWVIAALVQDEFRLKHRAFHNMGGARLWVTDRPDGKVVAEFRWGTRHPRIG